MPIIKYPYVTEKATALIDDENVAQFIVDINAKKSQIKDEMEKLFDVKVVDVRTMITPKGVKKAITVLSEKDSVDEVMTRLGAF
jgi:large subunit ribosomal protein L23